VVDEFEAADERCPVVRARVSGYIPARTRRDTIMIDKGVRRVAVGVNGGYFIDAV